MAGELGFNGSELRFRDGELLFGCCDCAPSDGCHWAILICNSNSITDDDFDIVLNGSTIGFFAGELPPSCPGNFFVTSNEISAADVRDGCCGTDITSTVISSALFTASNTLEMINVADNGSKNFGIVEVYRITVTGGVITTVDRCLASYYGGVGGTSFTYNFGDCPCEPDACCDDVGGSPTASFTAVNTTGCEYTLTSTSTLGSCGTTLSCHWDIKITAAGYVRHVTSDDCEVTIDLSICEIDWDNHEVDCDIEDPPRCSEQIAEITLTVTDDLGCFDEATDEISCGVTDCVVAGTVDVTQLSACSYQLCANVTEEETNCENPFVEIRILDDSACPADETTDRDCTCLQLFETPEDCHCGFYALSDGECMTLNLDESVRFIYRWWTESCGCPGEWSDPVELTCSPCECCDGSYDGAVVTVLGMGDCPDSPCDCTILNNQDYILLQGDDPCEGSASQLVECNINGTVYEAEFILYYRIFCNEAGYWVYVEQRMSLAGVGNARGQDIFLGPLDGPKPVCADISETGIVTSGSPAFCLWCDNSLVFLTIDFF
jgi:hypothetical protein